MLLVYLCVCSSEFEFSVFMCNNAHLPGAISVCQIIDISVVSALVMLKLGVEIEYTDISILQKIHNGSFHNKNASEK